MVLVVGIRTSTRPFGLSAALLALQALASRGRRRAGLVPRPGHLQRGREPLGEALKGKLAVAQLGARVLGRRGHARPQPTGDPGLLRVAQRG